MKPVRNEYLRSYTQRKSHLTQARPAFTIYAQPQHGGAVAALVRTTNSLWLIIGPLHSVFFSDPHLELGAKDKG